jgi:hypothetical protein
MPEMPKGGASHLDSPPDDFSPDNQALFNQLFLN